MLKSTLAGAFGVPLVVFLFIGFFIGPGALSDDLVIAIALGLIGAVGGLLIGVYSGFQASAEARRTKPIRQREAEQAQQEKRAAATANAQVAALIPATTVDEWNVRAGLLLKAGRKTEALATLDHALAAAPQSGEATWVLRQNRANILYELQRYQEALDVCDQVLKLQPAYMPTIRLRGDVLFSLGRNTEAIEMYDRALAANPTDVQMLNNKSAALGRLGRKKEGLQVCEQVLRLDPTNPVATRNRTAFLSS